MSANPLWKVELVHAADMRPFAVLDYPFSLTPTLNRPGSFSMTIPLDEDVAYQVKKHSTGVLCTRNGVARWSGEVVGTSKNASATTMSLTAVGWLDQLNHRFVRADEEAGLIFVGQVGGVIAQALLAKVNAQLDSDGVVRPTALGFANTYDVQVRDRSYKRSQSYGQAVQELSDVENGFDLFVDPLTRQVTTRAPDAYQDRTGVIFAYNVQGANLDDLTENDDGTSTAQRVTTVGDNGVAVSADDGAAIDAQGGFMRESWTSVSNVSEPTIIGAYANAEVVYARYGRTTYDLKVATYADVPRLYDGFDLGDKVYLSADAGALQLTKQPIRVFSVTLERDDRGNEVISQVGTSPP